MTTIIILAIYIVGVWAAYFKMLKWSNRQIVSADDCEDIFKLSTLSWLVFLLYGILWLYKRSEEE